jgi:hypothetical protein
MPFFRRQRTTASSPPPAPASPATTLDLGAALEIVLVKSVESQASVATQIGQLVTDNVRALSEMQQDSYKRASRRRGGQIRAGSAKRKSGKFARGCRLCDDAAVSDPTKEEIISHINHRNPSLNYRLEGNAVHVDLPESEIETDSQGNQVVECPDCQSGKAHVHGTN